VSLIQIHYETAPGYGDESFFVVRLVVMKDGVKDC
jgi:hypothetical protein